MNHSSSPIRHLGIITDGNRRWAHEHHLPSFAGHSQGVDTLEKVGDLCIERGIQYLTVWAFSTENWSRPKMEVSYLMRLLKDVARKKINGLLNRGVRLNVLGRIKEMPKDTRDAIFEAVEATKKNTKLVLNIAVNYGGRAEIVDAIKKMMKEKIDPSHVTEKLVSSFMYDPAIPEPDLVIRTGGAERTSGFLLWETPYSEWYHSKKKWPEFDAEELDRALDDFKSRTRNFGK